MADYIQYKVVKKVQETDLVVSLYLAATDGSALLPYQPGQHLTFRLNIPRHEVPVYRNYSFSDAYNKAHYRISIKKELPPRNHPQWPAGLASSYLVDDVQPGDILEARGPLGNFVLAAAEREPVAFFAGGIGITPLLSMVKSIAIQNPQRILYFIYALNEKKDHAFQRELHELRKNHPSFRFLIFYVKVRGEDVRGFDFDYEGLIDMAILVKETGGLDMHHFICGPAAMVSFIQNALLCLAVPPSSIHIESFSIGQDGPAVSAETFAQTDTAKANAAGEECFVEFTLSGKKCKWDKRYPSILTFAEANDVEISSGCLFGDCGTCMTPLLSGTVQYMHPTLVKPSVTTCLPCSCIPAGNISLEA